MCKQAALRSSCAACLHTNQSRSYLNHLTQYAEQTATGYTTVDIAVRVEQGRRSRNHCCHPEAIIIITFSQCVTLALDVWHAKRMRRITGVLIIP